MHSFPAHIVRQPTVRQSAYEYFMNAADIAWFKNPVRPKPPVYMRRTGSTATPTCASPVGQLTPPGETVQLTNEQYRLWCRI